MRLIIVSDGNIHTTKILNADTNELLEGVVSIEWECGVERAPQAICVLRLIDVQMELKVEDALVRHVHR